MGFPSEGFEARYRNSITDVQVFFHKFHQKSYQIYNLCSERKYKHGFFDKGSVIERFAFDDHNPPPFDIIFEFCKSCFEYLDSDTKRVAAIHCKAGKGRTGVMICCFLVFQGYHQQADNSTNPNRFQIKNAKDAMIYYGRIRTKDGKGVTIPS